MDLRNKEWAKAEATAAQILQIWREEDSSQQEAGMEGCASGPSASDSQRGKDSAGAYRDGKRGGASSTDLAPAPSIEDQQQLWLHHSLSDLLLQQLDDPLTIVSGAIPPWCKVLPMLCPMMFTKQARLRLLRTNAFGVSRSVIKVQELKVNVGPLRKKLAEVQHQATSLQQDAFSGNETAAYRVAELYSYADELQARIERLFRQHSWTEQKLLSIIGVIRREHLLEDADLVMDMYASQDNSKRRLELQFKGESGFDGNNIEAGVTRGFFSDVAAELMRIEVNRKVGIPYTWNRLQKSHTQEPLLHPLCSVTSPSVPCYFTLCAPLLHMHYGASSSLFLALTYCFLHSCLSCRCQCGSRTSSRRSRRSSSSLFHDMG
jgi:hypothetical protein